MLPLPSKLWHLVTVIILFHTQMMPIILNNRPDPDGRSQKRHDAVKGFQRHN